MEQCLELQLLFVWTCASMSIAIIVPVGVYVADHVQHHPLRDCVRTTDGMAAPTPSAAIIESLALLCRSFQPVFQMQHLDHLVGSSLIRVHHPLPDLQAWMMMPLPGHYFGAPMLAILEVGHESANHWPRVSVNGLWALKTALNGCDGPVALSNSSSGIWRRTSIYIDIGMWQSAVWQACKISWRPYNRTCFRTGKKLTRAWWVRACLVFTSEVQHLVVKHYFFWLEFYKSDSSTVVFAYLHTRNWSVLPSLNAMPGKSEGERRRHRDGGLSIWDDVILGFRQFVTIGVPGAAFTWVVSQNRSG